MTLQQTDKTKNRNTVNKTVKNAGCPVVAAMRAGAPTDLVYACVAMAIELAARAARLWLRAKLIVAGGLECCCAAQSARLRCGVCRGQRPARALRLVYPMPSTRGAGHLIGD